MKEQDELSKDLYQFWNDIKNCFSFHQKKKSKILPYEKKENDIDDENKDDEIELSDMKKEDDENDEDETSKKKTKKKKGLSFLFIHFLLIFILQNLSHIKT